MRLDWEEYVLFPGKMVSSDAWRQLSPMEDTIGLRFGDVVVVVPRQEPAPPCTAEAVALEAP